MNKDTIIGHILALITSFIWGTTFIATKVLLNDFSPVEILFFRFIIALCIFWIISPKTNQKTNKKHELVLLFAGFFGITLYFLFENTALQYTLASNVSVINCTAPLFTAILISLFYKNKEKINHNFFIGFILAILGIILVIFNGGNVHLNFVGDCLAILAALSWAMYSILIKRLANYNLPTLFISKKTFFYGILFMIPLLFFFNFHFGLSRFLNPVNTFNIVFLGLFASALCFVFWSKAIKLIGAIKCSAYIYLIPIITIISASFILHEPVSKFLIFGTVFTLCGLILSEKE